MSQRIESYSSNYDASEDHNKDLQFFFVGTELDEEPRIYYETELLKMSQDNLRRGSSQIVLERMHTPSKVTDETQFRQIKINERDVELPDNRVVTYKYNLLTFLPFNLFEQFRRLANFIFLVTIFVSLAPGVTPFPIWVISAPLVVLLSFTGAKEAYEDILRHREDKKDNNKMYHRIIPFGEDGAAGVQIVPNHSLRVGDIVKVTQGQQFPADLVVLSTSKHDNALYVNTANLDGETAPRVRHAVHIPIEHSDQDLAGLTGSLKALKPFEKFTGFQGLLKCNGEEFAVSDDNLVLRGWKLVMTESIYGVNYAAGKETKLMLNQSKTSFKFSSFESHLNSAVLSAVSLQLVVNVIVAAVAHSVTTFQSLERSPSRSFLEEMATGFILFSFFVPMSLYFTIEAIRIGQGILIEQDELLMVHENGVRRKAQVKTTNITDELGQIDAVFSDKTGTLTQNKMELRACFIGGITFPLSSQVNPNLPYLVSLLDSEFTVNSSDEWKSSPDMSLKDEIWEFLLCMILCNQVLLFREDPKNVLSLSPDELAFVKALEKMGLELIESNEKRKVFLRKGKEFVFQVHGVLDFSSDRKRMSIVCEDSDGIYRILSKGADSVLTTMGNALSMENLRLLEKSLAKFSNDGNRTLVFASKHLSKTEFDNWFQSFDKAHKSLGDRENAIEESFSTIEKDLNLLGVTSVEDPLQDGTPEAVDQLIDAGILVVVLTGDREETAVAVGRDAHIIRNDFRLLNIHNESTFGVEKALETVISTISTSDRPIAMIIAGNAVAVASKHFPSLFLSAIQKCSTVICNRATPSQKASLVHLVQNLSSTVGLAIGDGANDVSMIKTAKVGVGLIGREGSQAAQASDFVLHRFSDLPRLLFVHGRYAYYRSVLNVYWSFYKNFFYPMPILLYLFFSDFTNNPLYESLALNMLNILFTSLPPVVVGLFEKDIPEAQAMAYPFLYGKFRSEQRFSMKVFSKWVGLGILQGIVIFFIGFGVFWDTDVLTSDGKTLGIYAFGVYLSTACILTINATFFLTAKNWTRLFSISCIAGVVLYILAFTIWSNWLALFPFSYGLSEYSFGSAMFYLFLMICFVVTTSPVIVYRLKLNLKKVESMPSTHVKKNNVHYSKSLQ